MSFDQAKGKTTSYLDHLLDNLARDIAPKMTRILDDAQFNHLIVEKNTIIKEMQAALKREPTADKSKKQDDKIRNLETTARALRQQAAFLQERNATLEASMQKYWKELENENKDVRARLDVALKSNWHRITKAEKLAYYKTASDTGSDVGTFENWTAYETDIRPDATSVVTDVESATMDTAPTVIENTKESVHGISRNIGALSAGVYVCQFMTRDLGGRNVGLWVRANDNEAIHETFFDLQNPAIERVRAESGIARRSEDIHEVFSGWMLCSVVFALETDQADVRLQINIRHPSHKSSRYTGDGESGLAVWGIKLQAEPQADPQATDATDPVQGI